MLSMQVHNVNENIQMIFISKGEKKKKDNHGIHSITSPSQALNGIISNPRRHRTLEGKDRYTRQGCIKQTQEKIKNKTKDQGISIRSLLSVCSMEWVHMYMYVQPVHSKSRRKNVQLRCRLCCRFCRLHSCFLTLLGVVG